MTFTITEDHLKLARRMHVGWQDCEFGAPEINPKRPYGNSDVIGDIRTILDREVHECENCGHVQESQDDREELARLHAEMQHVLQIAFVTGEFKAGVYRKTSEYDAMSWELADEIENW